MKIGIVFLGVLWNAAALFGTSITYKDLQLPEQSIGASPATIADKEIQSDIDLLIYAFTEGYGGYNHLPKSLTANVVETLGGLPKNKSNRSVPNLCDAIGDALWPLPDNHIRAKLQKDCGLKRKVARRIASVGLNFGKNEYDRTKVPYAFRAVNLKSKSVAQLAIMQFAFSEDSSWTGFDAALGKIKGADALIVDLRGNGGGDDSKGVVLARILIGSKPTTDVDTTIARQSPAALMLLKNAYVLSKIVTRELGKVPEQYLDDRIRKQESKLALAEANNLPAENIVEQHPIRPAPLNNDAFKGPVLILVDANCASSCEGAMSLLKAHPNSRSIGENTAGYYQFGEGGNVLLPRSKILVTIPTKYFKFATGKVVDKVGFQPDIVVPKGEDALKAAMTLLATELR